MSDVRQETDTTPGPNLKATETLETFYLPIYVLTAVFGAIFIFGPLMVRKCQNKGIIRTCIMLSAFCMWLLWVTVYIAQMNPLVGPRLSNESLAWVAHSWPFSWAGEQATNPDSSDTGGSGPEEVDEPAI